MPLKDHEEAMQNNQFQQNIYYLRIKHLATSMFKWNNLPDDITERLIEDALFHHGQVGFTILLNKYVASKINGIGEINFYDVPTEYELYGTGSISGRRYNGEISQNVEKYPKDEILVPIRNNISGVSTDLMIRPFVEAFNEIDISINMNIKQQKFPVVIFTPEGQEITHKIFTQKHQEGLPFIYTTKDFELGNFQCFNMNIPFVADKMRIEKNYKWREIFEMLGINHANTEKRERLNSDEVNANNQALDLMCDSYLAPRLQACELINKIWGTNVTVERREQKIDDYLEGEEDV